jgi:predicted Fe-Mo cluster-binding NifX family protein
MVAVSSAGPNLDAPVDPRFGRCLYFVIVDTETMQYEAVPNTSLNAASGAGIQAAQTIAGKGARAVLTGNIGPNAYHALSAAGIQIITGVTGAVREVVTKYRKGEFKETNSPTVDGHFGIGKGRGMGHGRRRS